MDTSVRTHQRSQQNQPFQPVPQIEITNDSFLPFLRQRLQRRQASCISCEIFNVLDGRRPAVVVAG